MLKQGDLEITTYLKSVSTFLQCGVRNISTNLQASNGRVWPIKLVSPRHCLSKCLCQARNVNGHVFMCIDFSIFYDFDI